MIRRYRFIKDVYIWFTSTKIANKGFEFTHDIENSDYAIINGIKVDVSDLIQTRYIKEILPDEKPISSEENTNIKEDIYSKKYNIYEIFTLIPNLPKDTKFKCSLDSVLNTWEISDDEESLTLTYDSQSYESNSEVNLLECEYSLKQILEATYTIVKPIEEVKEKWVEIETHKNLCNAIVNKKMIRLGDGKPSNEYNDKQIETLFKALEHGVFIIEYLEEN